MMGPYYYYDSSFVEDVPATDYHIHDCMWSGECFTCQPANGALPMTLNAPPGYITLAPTRVAVQLHDVNNDNGEEGNDEEVEEVESVKDKTSALIQTSTRKRRLDKSVPTKRSNPRRNAMRPSSKECSTQDNKKLRHREVEKNRHRQLQAMVKTLSEKIPGRLDKETQVQTMKRAARYCLFLREAKNLLSHGLPQPHILKDKLKNIYSRSCDNVELIIAQSNF